MQHNHVHLMEGKPVRFELRPFWVNTIVQDSKIVTLVLILY